MLWIKMKTTIGLASRPIKDKTLMQCWLKVGSSSRAVNQGGRDGYII